MSWPSHYDWTQRSVPLSSLIWSTPSPRARDHPTRHRRSVGTPLIYTVIHRHPDNIDAPKTLADAGPTGGAPMLAGTPAAAIIDDIRPQPQDWVIMKPRFRDRKSTR